MCKKEGKWLIRGSIPYIINRYIRLMDRGPLFYVNPCLYTHLIFPVMRSKMPVTAAIGIPKGKTMTAFSRRRIGIPYKSILPAGIHKRIILFLRKIQMPLTNIAALIAVISKDI